MFKSLFIPLSVLLAAPLAQATIYYPKGVTASCAQSSQKVIAWDIHNVLAIKDGKAKAGAIIGNIFPILWSKITADKAWDEINSIPKSKDLSGEAYMYIFLKHGNPKLAKMAEKAANAYKPRPGMQQLVVDINNAGITQRLASNIGPDFCINLSTKFKSQFDCNLFDYIKPGKVVDYSIYGPAHLQKKLVNQEVSPVGKPDLGFFNDFNTTYNAHKKELIIFVDDKIENINAAVAAGWIGIHLDVNQKDPVATLRSELESLGVFSKKTFSTPLSNGITYV